MWYRWTEAISEKKVFYGYTLGNHDSEADLTRRQIVDLDMLHPYSLTKQAEAPGYGASTFVIPVMSSKNPEEVVMNLWFFDSEDYNCLGVLAAIHPSLTLTPDRDELLDSLREVIDWYRQKSAELEKTQGGKKPGVAFMHIAPPEYMFAYDVSERATDNV